MPIKIMSKLEFNAEKHFLNRLLHSDGRQYALGVKDVGHEYPMMWFIDHKGVRNAVKALDLVELDKLPKKGTSPAVKIWSTKISAPYAVRHEFNYAGKRLVKDTYALDAKKGLERALRWLSFTLGKPFNEVHEYFKEHPQNLRELR